MSSELTFKAVESDGIETTDPADNKDPRNVIQRMFCDYNKLTGSIEALPLHPEKRSEYKHLHDCIPILIDYKGDDEEYSGPLKGKNVIVFGGRRKSRAGTGVELLLDLNHVEEFSDLIKQVSKAAADYLATI